MADKILPTVNFDSNPGLDEFTFLHETYSEEFRYRQQIGSTPGVVDFSGDPATAPFTAGRPLLVTVSTVNPLTIDVAAGFAVTPSNLLVNIDAAVPSIPLEGITADKIYVVCVEYLLVDSGQTRLNRFGIPTDIRRERPSNVPPGGGASTLLSAITIADLNDFNNLSIFPQDRKNNIVSLGIVTVRQDPTTAQLSLSIDLSRETYTFNRPWFSSVDTEHRSKVGSGVVSDRNPHGTELQDLSSAGLTLYQQLKMRGGIISKDFNYYGYPGAFCTETITLSRIESDSNGEITTPPGQPLLGGRFFVRLAKRPVRPGSLYFEGKPWEPVPYQWIPGTNIIVLGSLEQPSDYTANLILEYFAVDALEVNFESLTQGMQTLTVKNPLESKEFIVSAGLAIDSLAQTSLPLTAVLGPIKKKYQVLCDGAGALLLSPQPIVSILKVADLYAAAPFQINQSPSGGLGVPLIVGLTRAIERTIIGATTFDLDVRVRIAGVDDAGVPLTEDLVFKAAQWKDQSAGVNEEEPLQFRTTKNSFQIITSVTLTNTTTEPPNAGPDAVISIWADVTKSSANYELANVASLFWTGTTGIRVRDERAIATTLQKLDQKQSRFPAIFPEDDGAFSQELLSTVLDPPLTDLQEPSVLQMRELDDDRYWGETWGQFSSVDASGQIFLNSFAALAPGHTIRVATGKTLRVVASGANPSLGEVNMGTSDVIHKNNLIATINDPTFDSTWFATLGQGSNPPIVLTRQGAYPEGFQLNVRKQLTFVADFLAGSFSLTIEGTPIGPVAFTVSNDATLTAIVAAINAQQSVTGVFASLFGSSPYHVIILNGPASGADFSVTALSSSGGAPAAALGVPFDAYTLVQPTGGSLPTPHLPQRYPSAGYRWEYQTRPYLWDGVFLRSQLSFNGNNPAFINNLDKLEIVPGKVLTAKRGALVTVNPTIGEFLVDPGSIANTLANIEATINNSVFASGVLATVVGNAVTLDIAGYSIAQIQLLVETVPGTWIYVPYAPVGGGDALAHAIVKAIQPLAFAEWRYLLVPTLSDPDPIWSQWTGMTSLSPTAFRLDGPVTRSFYAIQIRMQSQTGNPNGFSVYRFIPQTSGASLPAIDARLQDVEDELADARGALPDLDTRISAVVDSAGVMIQDPELLAARVSTIRDHPAVLTVKERLDASDALAYWLTGGVGNTLKPSLMVQPGTPPRLLQGPVDGDGNSAFFTTVGPLLQVGGTGGVPFYYSLLGYSYRYARKLDLDFTGQAASTYYIYATVGVGDEGGLTILTSTTTSGISAGAELLNDTGANFTASGVLPGHYVVVTSSTIQGQSFYSPIRSVVGATQLQIEGRFPALSSGVTYSVKSPRELAFAFTATKTVSSSRIYLGEVAWTGAAFSSVRNYRYENHYSSPLVAVTAAPNFEISFNHNLGFLPKAFTVYFHTSPSGDAEPKVVNVGDEVILKTSSTTMTLRNRYQNQVVKDYAGTVQTTGYLQLVV